MSRGRRTAASGPNVPVPERGREDPESAHRRHPTSIRAGSALCPGRLSDAGPQPGRIGDDRPASETNHQSRLERRVSADFLRIILGNQPEHAPYAVRFVPLRRGLGVYSEPRGRAEAERLRQDDEQPRGIGYDLVTAGQLVGVAGRLHPPAGLALPIDVHHPGSEQIAVDPEQNAFGRGLERRFPDAALPLGQMLWCGLERRAGRNSLPFLRRSVRRAKFLR